MTFQQAAVKPHVAAGHSKAIATLQGTTHTASAQPCFQITDTGQTAPTCSTQSSWVAESREPTRDAP